MAVRGGALPGVYNTRQFHIHWGNGSFVPGSEHAINGKRYPMEVKGGDLFKRSLCVLHFMCVSLSHLAAYGEH